jgi:hypothetical protein
MTEKAAKTSEIISNGQNSLTQIEYIDVSYATPYVKFRKEREGR